MDINLNINVNVVGLNGVVEPEIKKPIVNRFDDDLSNLSPKLERYAVVEYLVRRGKIKPTHKAIRSLGVGDGYAKHYMERMVTRKVITKPSPGKAGKVRDVAKLANDVDKFEKLIRAA